MLWFWWQGKCHVLILWYTCVSFGIVWVLYFSVFIIIFMLILQETNPGCGGPISTPVSVLLVVIATVLTLALARLSWDYNKHLWLLFEGLSVRLDYICQTVVEFLLLIQSLCLVKCNYYDSKWLLYVVSEMKVIVRASVCALSCI